MMNLLQGCGHSQTVIKNNTIRIPDNLIAELQHPIATDYPYTVHTLLIIISQYEALIEKANDRFREIKIIQSGETAQTGV